jgi:D-glycero-D-manno-heptose 1,7-bisphosphate phosphatase
MKPILVKTGNGQTTLKEKKYPKKTKVFVNLFEAVNFIISNE